MTDNEVLTKIHQFSYEMLSELDKICKKYDVEYYIAYGTLLFAIRDLFLGTTILIYSSHERILKNYVITSMNYQRNIRWSCLLFTGRIDILTVFQD